MTYSNKVSIDVQITTKLYAKKGLAERIITLTVKPLF